MTSPAASGETNPSAALAWRVVAFLWIAYLLNYIDRQVVFSIFPALRRDLGFSDASLGLIGTVFTWTYSFCMPFTGRAADLVRRDRIVVASLLLWSGATLATGLSGSVGWFLFWRAVMGVTESLYVPAALGLIAGLHGTPTRSRALALHAAAQFGGIFAGGSYGGWMADHIGWRAGFHLLAAAGAAYALVLLRVFRTLPAPVASNRAAAQSPLAVFRSRSYLALSAAFFAYCGMLWMLYAWLPNFIYERYRLSMAESGFIATLYIQTGSAAGVLLGGWAGDRMGNRVPGGRFYAGAAGLIACAPLAWVALKADSLTVLRLACTGFGVFAGLFMANIFASAYDVIAERDYGFATGALNTLGGFAGGAAILAAGVFRMSVGMAGLMQWASSAAVLTGIAMVIVVRRDFGADRRRAVD